MHPLLSKKATNTQKQAATVRWVPIERLVPAVEAKDPRDVAALADKIKQSGRFEPIEVMEYADDNSLYIEDGNTRYYAAKALNMAEVPVQDVQTSIEKQSAENAVETAVTCQLDIMDAHRGELFGKVTALIGDEEVGYVKFSEYSDLYAPGLEEGDEVPRAININYVEVKSEYRRQGIATKMYQKIQEDFPGEAITSAGTTDEGGAFRRTLKDRGVLASVEKLKKTDGKWVCPCGNDDGKAFYNSDENGIEVEEHANSTLNYYFTCNRCHRVFSANNMRVVRQGVQHSIFASEPPAGVREYAKQVAAANSTIEGIYLIGSSVDGPGDDIDLLYDFGQIGLDDNAEEDLEALLEAQEGLDFAAYDTFVKADGRYFHLAAGAGRSIVENTEYAKAQENKPMLKLAWNEKPQKKKSSSEMWERIKQDFSAGIVYHGTTLEIAELVMREGFRGLEWDEIVQDVLDKYGKKLEDLDPMWQKIMAQTGRSYTHEYHLVSTSPAGEVATRFSGQGGEVASQIEAYIQGTVSTREVQNSRIAGEPVVIMCRIKDFQNTEDYKRVQQWINGLERLAAEGGIDHKYTLDDAAESLWTQYSNFLCKPEELEPIRVIKGATFELLKRGPLPQAKGKSSSEKPSKNASTQINIPEELAFKMQQVAKRLISKEDLAGDGYEDHPHITVKYGVAENEDGLIEAVHGQAPFEIVFGKTHVFEPSKSSEGTCPVVIEIEAPELHKLHETIAAAIGTRKDDFEYKAHATLAYVKAEAAKKYDGLDTFEGITFEANSITLSKRDKLQITVAFGLAKTASRSDATSSMSLSVSLKDFPPVVVIRWPQRGMRWRQVLKTVKQIAGEIAGQRVPWRKPRNGDYVGEPMIHIFESPWGSYNEQQEQFPQWAANQKLVMYDISPDGTYQSVGKTHTPPSPKMSSEKVTKVPMWQDEGWECICKNRSDTYGFYPCNSRGEKIEIPANGKSHSKLYVCEKCGRIINQSTLRVVGQAQEGLFGPNSFYVNDNHLRHRGSHKVTPLSDTTFENGDIGQETNGYANIPERTEGTEMVPSLEELAPEMFKSGSEDERQKLLRYFMSGSFLQYGFKSESFDMGGSEVWEMNTKEASELTPEERLRAFVAFMKIELYKDVETAGTKIVGYHGTDEASAETMVKRGVRAGTFLATSRDRNNYGAEYYGDTVVRVEIDPENVAIIDDTGDLVTLAKTKAKKASNKVATWIYAEDIKNDDLLFGFGPAFRVTRVYEDLDEIVVLGEGNSIRRFSPTDLVSIDRRTPKTGAYAEAQNSSQHTPHAPHGMYKTLKSDPFWEEWELFGDKEDPAPEEPKKSDNAPSPHLKHLVSANKLPKGYRVTVKRDEDGLCWGTIWSNQHGYWEIFTRCGIGDESAQVARDAAIEWAWNLSGQIRPDKPKTAAIDKEASLNNLESMGLYTAEEAKVPGYELHLVGAKDDPEWFELALQQTGQDASVVETQHNKLVPKTLPREEMKAVLDGWLRKYPKIHVMSYNEKYLARYVRLLERVGYKVNKETELVEGKPAFYISAKTSEQRIPEKIATTTSEQGTGEWANYTIMYTNYNLEYIRWVVQEFINRMEIRRLDRKGEITQRPSFQIAKTENAIVSLDKIKSTEAPMRGNIENIKQELPNSKFIRAIAVLKFPRSNRLYIGDGNHRYEVAKQLGFSTIPCVTHHIEWVAPVSSSYPKAASAKPVYKDVKGAPFKIGMSVRYILVIDEDEAEELDLKKYLGKTGTLEYYEYSCGCGQSYPKVPMIGVRFPDGKLHEFWPEELEPAS